MASNSRRKVAKCQKCQQNRGNFFVVAVAKQFSEQQQQQQQQQQQYYNILIQSSTGMNV
jgi:hypothetical protein